MAKALHRLVPDVPPVPLSTTICTSLYIEMVDKGEATFVIGIEIFRDRSRGLLGLSYKGNINRVLERFYMQFFSHKLKNVQIMI